VVGASRILWRDFACHEGSGDPPWSARRPDSEDPGKRVESWLKGGIYADVIAPPPGELFSETNDNSVAILLSYGGARVLLAGDAEAREEEYMASGPYTGPLTVINVPKLHTL
jgi:beta-lactamase superfamily II metal-dependent hydrolase